MTTPGSVASVGVQTLSLKVAVYAVGFGTSVLISRALGPEGRGAYYFPVVAATMLTTVATLGIEQANFYLMGSRRVDVARLWGQAGLVALVMGLCGLGALMVGPAVLPGLFAGTRPTWLWLAGLTIPLALHAQFGAGLLTLQGRVTWQFRVGLVAALVQVGLLTALQISVGLGVTAVLVANLVTGCLTWMLVVWPLRECRPWLAWDASLLRATLAQALPLHLGVVLLYLHLRLDMFMVKAWSGDTALGHYSLAVTLAETVMLATDSLALALLPRQIANTVPEAATLALRGARINAVAALGAGAVWLVCGWPLVNLVYGRAFGPAYLPLVLLLPGMVFIGMQRVCGAPALRSGRPWWVAGIMGASLALNAALNVWWIPIFGPSGAALASTVSYVVSALVFLIWTIRLAGARWSAAVPRLADVGALWHGIGTTLRPAPARMGTGAKEI